MKKQNHYDVIIIGAAIAGATLVNILVDQGLSVLVLDKEEGVLEIPRAAHIDDEVLRYFEQFDVSTALPESYQIKGEFNFFDFEGRKFLSFPEPAMHDQGIVNGHYFHQPDFEHYFRDRAVDKGATLLTQHEVVDLSQDAEKVTITYRDCAPGGDPETHTATAEYVVACDGATSFTRKHLGISMEKLAEASSHIIVDFTVKDGVPLPDDMGYWTWAKISRQDTTIYVHMPKGVKRLEFDVPEGMSREEAEGEENTFKLIAPWVQRKDVDKVLRSSVYTYHSLVADSWQEGRVFLAGDAAHMTPPFLGQGACAAVRDVFNLGWKLARVVKGESPAALLKTYQTERRPHARELVLRAGKIGEMFKNMVALPEEEVRALQPSEHTIERPLLGAGLHGTAPAPAGRLGPQPRLADGRLMDAVAGDNFALVGDPSLIDGMSDNAKSCLASLNAVIIPDASADVRAALEAIGGRVMLVRPDHYVLGVANSAEEIDKTLARSVAFLLPRNSSIPNVATA